MALHLILFCWRHELVAALRLRSSSHCAPSPWTTQEPAEPLGRENGDAHELRELMVRALRLIRLEIERADVSKASAERTLRTAAPAVPRLKPGIRLTGSLRSNRHKGPVPVAVAAVPAACQVQICPVGPGADTAGTAKTRATGCARRVQHRG
jgi:hypothetical protein